MKDDKDFPLVTFALFSYNQERFIREAIEGAFSQTYSPLEIILSDDCSSDRTFEIIEEMAQSYDGSQMIILNRNKSNLGMGHHVNKVFNLATGELVIFAAGDDISSPQRTTTILKRWERYGRPSAVSSGHTKIDEFGHKLNERKKKKVGTSTSILEDTSLKNLRHNVLLEMGTIHGCTAAYSKKIHSSFPNLQSNVVQEDDCLAFRAQLLGGVLCIPDVLVKYRFHTENVWNRNDEDSNALAKHNLMLAKIRSKGITRRCQKNDLEFFEDDGWLLPSDIRPLIRELSRQEQFYINLEIWHTNTGFSKYQVIPKLLVNNRVFLRRKIRRTLKKISAVFSSVGA